jgi:hypothetical protein
VVSDIRFLDKLFLVVLVSKGGHGFSDVVDGLEHAAVDGLLRQGPEHAFNDAFRFRLADEGAARGYAPELHVLLEVIGHEVAAVIVAEREAARGVGAELSELLADGHGQRLDRLETCSMLGDMPAEHFGVPVLGLLDRVIERQADVVAPRQDQPAFRDPCQPAAARPARLPDVPRDVKPPAVRASAIGWQNRAAFQLNLNSAPQSRGRTQWSQPERGRVSNARKRKMPLVSQASECVGGRHHAAGLHASWWQAVCDDLSALRGRSRRARLARTA